MANLVFFVVVKHMLRAAARRAEALGWRYEAHLRGLERCNINLTTTQNPSCSLVFRSQSEKPNYEKR